MKIHWFSPLQPASTDIAHYTLRVLPALAERAEVFLWTAQKECSKELERHAIVRRYDPTRLPIAELNRDGVSIYHIGNNPLFHGSIWQLSRVHSGVVVLHDARLHHLFDGIYREQKRDAASYLAEMQFYYGDAGRRDGAQCFQTDARNIDQMAARYPLTPLALRDALGVLVHTREAFDELRRENRWPVAYAPLPFASARALSQKRYARKIANRQMMSDETPYRLIVFGYLGRNRRLDVILNALAQMPEGKRFHLDIYGEVLDGESLYPLIGSLKLEEQVTLRGFVSDQKLDEALDCADLAFNLRNPTMGEASGSQLRLWNHALPSLVTKIGWYATLPEDAVAHVRPEHEIEDIQTHLRALLREQSRFKTMGERGRVILEQEHAPEKYADTLIALARRAVRFQPQSAANKLAERAGALISEWNEPLTPDESVKKVAAEIRALFSAASGTVHDAASIRASAGKRRTQ